MVVKWVEVVMRVMSYGGMGWCGDEVVVVEAVD